MNQPTRINWDLISLLCYHKLADQCLRRLNWSWLSSTSNVTYFVSGSEAFYFTTTKIHFSKLVLQNFYHEEWNKIDATSQQKGRKPNLRMIRSQHATCFPKRPADRVTVSISRDKEPWHPILGSPTLFTVPTCCLLCCIQIRFFLCFAYILLVSYPLVSEPIRHLKHMHTCCSKHLYRWLWLAVRNNIT